MSATYSEPPISVLVLDYCKPIESRICLESVRRHLKVPHRVIFCDNGSGEDYPIQFLREGLIDQLIVNRDSRGLGLGTKDLFALAASPYSFYLQNDQYLARDISVDEWERGIKPILDQDKVYSLSLAGAPCGQDVYSERGHIIKTRYYQWLEQNGYLGYHGAGPYHNGEWREAQMQRFYRENDRIHYIYPAPAAQDNGVFAVRDMGDGGLWVHRTDTKQAWMIRKPLSLEAFSPVYPKLTDMEKAFVMMEGWPDGIIPSSEVKDSFLCWSHTELAQRQDEYIADLRRRKG